MKINRKIGDRIRFLRNAQKLSQEEIALRADIGRSFMTHIESGKRNISIETLEKVLSALEISFAEFFNHSEFKSK